MRKGIVLILDEGEMINAEDDIMAVYTRSEVYQADLVICGEKVIKNRWGKPGTIGGLSLEQRIEEEKKFHILLDIWHELMDRKLGEINERNQRTASK